MLPITTIDGRLVADPELRFTQSGKAACNIRIAANDSRKTDAGEWENTEQIFISATIWEADGEAAAEALAKGDKVLVTGRIYQREYETNSGEKRTSLELKFPTVAKVIHARKGSNTQTAPRPAADPWAASSSNAGGRDEPPF